MTSTAHHSVVHDTFTLERDFSAPSARVFAAFADPVAKAQWFGDQLDLTAPRGHDFRIGGHESLRARDPQGGPDVTYDAVYCDIVAPSRLVYSYEMTMDDTRISVSLTTIEFLALPVGTRLVLTEQGAFLDGLDSNAARRGGTADLLDGLGRYLETVTV